MANQQLRAFKDEAHTKLRLALFTADLEDNKALAARVAHLESEWAGAALAHGRLIDAQTGLVAAAAAHKTLGNLPLALDCLVRASAVRAGDAECRALLAEAISDLRKTLAPAVPKAKPAAKPDPKSDPKVEPKVDPKPDPKAEKKPAPKAEKKPAPKAEKKPAPKAEKKPEKKGLKDLFKKKDSEKKKP